MMGGESISIRRSFDGIAFKSAKSVGGGGAIILGKKNYFVIYTQNGKELGN